MKRTIILLLIIALSLLSITTTSYAASDVSFANIEYYEDGSYLETIIESETVPPYISLLSTTVTKSKTTKFYDANNVAKWYVKVTGTFTYGKVHQNAQAPQLLPNHMLLLGKSRVNRQAKAEIQRLQKLQQNNIMMVL